MQRAANLAKIDALLIALHEEPPSPAIVVAGVSFDLPMAQSS